MGNQRITAEELHVAADKIDAEPGKGPENHGFAEGALEAFVEETDFHPEGEPDALVAMSPLSLAYGITIGLRAGLNRAEARLSWLESAEAVERAARLLYEDMGKPLARWVSNEKRGTRTWTEYEWDELNPFQRRDFTKAAEVVRDALLEGGER